MSDSPQPSNWPRRFRSKIAEPHPAAGSRSQYRYGVYFPLTDLVVNDMGGRGTGKPERPEVEWLDPEPKYEKPSDE